MVVPPGLIDATRAGKHTMDAFAAGHTQAALAEFIREGHLATHLRRLLVEYDRRRRALLAALETVSDELEVGHSEGGMHLTVYLRRSLDERAIAERCLASGVALAGLSRFYQGSPRRGFVLGFACASPPRIHAAMRTVAQQLRKA
jgi:GntR family transcriptional regulator/MocR family aminotransferase